MTTKTVGHTPRPWLTKWNGAHGHVVLGGNSGSYLGVISGVAPGISTDEGKANARLIAAAPELLEALEQASFGMRNYVRGEIGFQEALEKVEAAIRKARGE